MDLLDAVYELNTNLNNTLVTQVDVQRVAYLKQRVAKLLHDDAIISCLLYFIDSLSRNFNFVFLNQLSISFNFLIWKRNFKFV